MKISKGTIIRTAVLLAALVNQGLTACGKSPLPIGDEVVAEFVGNAWIAVAAVAAWWKNNSFSDNAIKADSYLDELKGE